MFSFLKPSLREGFPLEEKAPQPPSEKGELINPPPLHKGRIEVGSSLPPLDPLLGKEGKTKRSGIFPALVRAASDYRVSP
ncbi:protein of unknown function [Nitrospina watsonii]|uniref:Uncharacterized protein n=1 Tax=Nitrospina watsonii TaxID=1323948 RepID=A0ABN8VTN6_9BACT|nr:protein of unknown function [Nitrospina watsonii]